MQPVIAQAIGVVAMFFNIFSFQQKKAKHIIACQLVGGFFFSVSYFLLGAFIGAILNLVAVVRAVLFLKKEKFHTDHIGWLIGFSVLYVGAYVLNFAVLGQEPTVKNLIIESLPVIGMVSTHLAFRYNAAKTIRRISIISSCAWLIYNIVNVAVGAILCEAFSLVSIFTAMVRLDREKVKESK